MEKIIQQIFDWFGFLGWVEISASILVSVGCLGELWILINKLTLHIEPLSKSSNRFWHSIAWFDARFRPLLMRLKINSRKLPKGKEELLERVFVLMVAAGVSIELICLPFSMHEVATLNNKAADAWTNAASAIVFSKQIGTTNAQLVALNISAEAKLEKLRKENNWLAAYMNPRSIQMFHADSILEKIPDIQVAIVFSGDCDDCQSLAMDMQILVETSNSVHWKVGEIKKVPHAVGVDGVEVYGLDDWPNDDLSKPTLSQRAAKLFVKQLFDVGIAARYIPYPDNIPPPLRLAQFPTNGIVVYISGKPTPNHAKSLEISALNDSLQDEIDELLALFKKTNSTNEQTRIWNQIRNLEDKQMDMIEEEPKSGLDDFLPKSYR